MLSKYTLKDCQDMAEKQNGKCLSTEYVSDSSGKLQFECCNGHPPWFAQPYDILKGTWCKPCGIESRAQKQKDASVQRCIDRAREMNGKFLSTEYINNMTPLKWECSKGHPWDASAANVLIHKSWCPVCADTDRRTTQINKNGLQRCIDKAKEMNGKCLSTEYINNKTPMEWECCKGHKWKVKPTHILFSKSWCPECKLKSESECRCILEILYGVPFEKCNPSFLMNPETGYNLELDGYNQELKLAFEYQGFQHYEPVEFWGGREAFDAIVKRDRLKRRLCKKKGVTLIEIPFWVEDREEYIFQELFDSNAL